MPNCTISVYLNDEDYEVYAKHKTSWNEEARQLIKQKIKGEKK